MRISYLERGREAYADLSIDDFDLAKQMAEDAVAIGTADRVEIFDDDSKLMFQCPRVLSANRT